ncbi:cell division cycle-associated protein 3 isoform X1 [Notechis scutatus]|uniref:Cell division cycle-associated protein 3 isoform X1 n=2 Tax=Notechis scutatus TaxID=8663 RepID=A0A6J1VGN7_9SAUR|nr:cell division cycle-associated protein 3 isoform X1 [Notechis scutatus]
MAAPSLGGFLRSQTVAMGASESFLATPTCTPLLNKHLKNVRDPRSPTAGILRTPIEVESSPKDNTRFPKQGELVAESQHENWDPRSPTPGISRTPLKDVLADAINYPVKLFCENFMGENSEEELPQDESQHQDQKPEFTFGMEERTARSTVSSGEIFLEDSQQAEGENEQLFSMVSVTAATKPVQSARIIHPTGIKSVKRRVSNKMLGMPTGTGRSPLGILHGDNSPISLASHQSKRSSSVTDNQRETKDGTLSFGTNFPADSCGWDLMNKENRQCRWVEN